MILETISVNSPAIFWCFTALQMLGLFSMAGARFNEGSVLQTSFHQVFIVCMVLVGAGTMIALGMGSSCWITCCATLAIMMLGATLDLGSSQRAASY